MAHVSVRRYGDYAICNFDKIKRRICDDNKFVKLYKVIILMNGRCY